MWFRLRLSPTHEFSAFVFDFNTLYWSDLDVIQHYPDYADHSIYSLTMVGHLTKHSLSFHHLTHYRFTDDYLNHLVLDHQSFENILKDNDPTLYAQFIQLMKENQPITMLSRIQDNFSWEKCLCIEPSATGKWTIRHFLREFMLQVDDFYDVWRDHVKVCQAENPWKCVEPMMELMAMNILLEHGVYGESDDSLSEEEESDDSLSVEGESDYSLSVEEKNLKLDIYSVD